MGLSAVAQEIHIYARRTMAIIHTAGILLLYAICVQCQPAFPSFGCPHGYVAYSFSCYKAFRTTATWIQAKSYCEAFSSTLVIIESQAEEQFIVQYLNSTKADYPTQDFWIDGSDLLVEGDWMWARTNTLVKYTNWDVASGNPSNNHGNENCMEIEMSKNGLWNDDVCQRMQSFICERLASEF